MTRKRRFTRLPNYDDARPGANFVTICTHHRKQLFDEIVYAKMHLNEFGKIAQKEWLQTEQVHRNLSLDIFIIMPNHIPGIILITHNNVGADLGVHDIPMWQRGYFGHIIRNNDTLNQFRGYIQDNPIRWEFDRYNPERTKTPKHALTFQELIYQEVPFAQEAQGCNDRT